MANHRQRPAGRGHDGSCLNSESEQPRSDQSVESGGTSYPLPSHQTRQLFGSLEEAHNRITRPYPSGMISRITGDTASSDSGDDGILKDMRRLSPVVARAIYTNVGYPVTRAFSRSVTDGANRTVEEPALVPSPLLVQKQLDADGPRKDHVFASPPASKTSPVAWQDATTRFPEAQAFAEANTSNQPPPYSPTGKLDRSIGHRGPATRNSFAVASEPQPRPLPYLEADRHGRVFGPNTMPRHVAEEGIRAPPQTEPPNDPPFHPSNPFAASSRLKASERVLRVTNPSPPPQSPVPSQNLDLSNSEDNGAHRSSDRGVASSVGFDSESAIASDESKLSNMLPPPARMHSVRQKERRRQSFSSSGGSSLIGGGLTERSEEDPFHYDSVFLRPSREREVSAFLHRVSGVERGSTAIICSPDGSPLRNSQQFADKRSHSPEVQSMMLDSQVSPLHLPQHQQQQRAAVGSVAQNKQDQNFFEPSAIDPRWAVGSPGVVRVPVRERVQSCQDRNTGSKHPDAQDKMPNLVLEGLRGCEEQNRLSSGNTEG
jgi:hypothetical protein